MSFVRFPSTLYAALPLLAFVAVAGDEASGAQAPRVFHTQDFLECAIRLSTPYYRVAASPLAVDEAGDFDGDGLSDIIVALDDKLYYIIYGQEGLWGESLDSQSIWARRPEVRKTRIRAPSTLPTPLAVGGGGDVNGDGYDDVVVGAAEDPVCTGDRCSVRFDRPIFYLIFGGARGLAEEVEVENLVSSGRAAKLVPPVHWTRWVQGHATIEVIPDMSGDGYDELGIADSGVSVSGGLGAGVLGGVVRFSGARRTDAGAC